MSNEIKIEDTVRDNHMDGEIHLDKRCEIQKRVGTYRENTGRLERTLKVLIYFMVCHCKNKKRNPLPDFDDGQCINLGESVDLHLGNKKCYYEKCTNTDDTKFNVWYKCFCNCRHPSLSHPGR
jgi:hypothetical protein